MPVQPGPIVLMGSGETSPTAQKAYHRLFTQFHDGVRIAILETPAGFEPNSAYVAGQIAAYLEKRLQNFRPSIQVVPARRRGTPFSPDNPELAATLHDANVILMGPGSPTYAVRQLQGSLLWHTLRACHRLGATLVLASAATLAVSRYTLPVYEIYKVGEDLHWKAGLDFFSPFGLSTIFVSHWNNSDGGEVLDTSRCYIGQDRFDALVGLLPGAGDDHTLVGIDENTALWIDGVAGACTVLGAGQVTITRSRRQQKFASGECFGASELGPFRLPEPSADIPEAVWQTVRQGRDAAERMRDASPRPDAAVLALLDERTSARANKDWASSDRLRDAIEALGWHVLDTPAGPVLEQTGS